jgi:hypothetical protein
MRGHARSPMVLSATHDSRALHACDARAAHRVPPCRFAGRCLDLRVTNAGRLSVCGSILVGRLSSGQCHGSHHQPSTRTGRSRLTAMRARPPMSPLTP